jgi:putative acyl-CoA dehydrogenase
MGSRLFSSLNGNTSETEMDWQTHEITNQFDERVDYDLYTTDQALRDAVRRGGAAWAEPQLAEYGRRIGSAEGFELADQANRRLPELHAFDRRGRRVNRVEFHASYHELLRRFRGTGWISVPFDSDRAGRWVTNVAGMYLHTQVENGTQCPITMTTGAMPLLRREPALWAQLGDKLFNTEHDERDLPIAQKKSVYIGMGMTEKQGGSDVRANTTCATPLGAGGRGGEYLIRGHKWFFSAPMCDAHLVVARLPDAAPTCFYVPRWKPDGTRNAIHIQRLKNKVGNRSNSSSEVEFQDAWGVMMGEEGRGIPLIIEMASYTRLCCIASSAAIIRQATTQAIAYTRQRKAFGRVLADQPLMRGVLADLVLESEAALAMTMRLASAFEEESDPAQRIWKRLVTPAAKFWICKRAVELTGEAMEVFGGNGYVDDGPMARLFREAPVNSIWEGSGNVMCLDVMRAIGRDPAGTQALMSELAEVAGTDVALRQEVDALRAVLDTPSDQREMLGRSFAQRLVLALQAMLLRQSAPAVVADAFIGTRLGDRNWGRVAGAIDARTIDVDALLARALPA